jgi:hypothetical protein
MNQLMDTLIKIQDQCKDAEEKKKEKEEAKSMDEFTRLRKQISKDIKETRQVRTIVFVIEIY